MADHWYYRMFGEEFGPVPFEKLKELTELGTITACDEVRSTRDTQWKSAASVGQLGLGNDPNDTAVVLACTAGTDTEVCTITAGADDWYCQVGDQELGPLSFGELLKYAEHEHLSADDQVKLGPNGKWRRAGSIGRLMAVLPYQTVQRRHAEVPSKSKAITSGAPLRSGRQSVTAAQSDSSSAGAHATCQEAYEQAKAQLAESLVAQAEADYRTAEQQARNEYAWAFAPNVDPYWWGWMGGQEFGPVEFMQVFGLAKNGQLKPTDFVRNGQYGQYVPSSNVPGLFSAVAMMARAAEALRLAKGQAQAAAALALPPAATPALKFAQPTPVAAPSSRQIVPPAAKREARSVNSNPVVATLSAPTHPPSKVETAISTSTHKEEAGTGSRRTPQTEEKPLAAASEPRPSSFSSPASVGYSSSMYSNRSSGASSRPAVPVRPPIRKPSVSDSSWFTDMLESLKEPKALAVVGALACVAMVVGWQYLPKSKAEDIKHYQALKQIMDQLGERQSSKSTDFAAWVSEAEKAGKQVAAAVKDKASRDEPAKQYLLWAARDELPRMVASLQATPAVVSKEEKSFALRLNEVARELRLPHTPAPAVADSTTATRPRGD